ncbi:hypothetical protein ATANTOWER_002681 [Ataeniobius toweri]|uniref:Uncharacterized protein n=1 Tax=Ataeniobius toweri TaxID=208326 RepID=A0ABU7BX36_9TELE|nr:hypothetical protein [Ataeniobius toweri]
MGPAAEQVSKKPLPGQKSKEQLQNVLSGVEPAKVEPREKGQKSPSCGEELAADGVGHASGSSAEFYPKTLFMVLDIPPNRCKLDALHTKNETMADPKAEILASIRRYIGASQVRARAGDGYPI